MRTEDDEVTLHARQSLALEQETMRTEDGSAIFFL